MESVDLAEVEAGWCGRRGILNSLAPLVTRWFRTPLTREILGKLYLTGDRPDSDWAKWSDGTFLVSRCVVPKGRSFRAAAPIRLSAVEGLGRRVLIDGNHQAIALWRKGGEPAPGSTIYIGELSADFIALVQPISPIWLPVVT